MIAMFDKFWHGWLRVPYLLHATTHHSTGRPRGTIVLLHGIGSSGKVWGDVIALLPKDVCAVTVDLLGFGDSPRPDIARYDTKNHARAVRATLRRLRIRGSIVLVGHSLGALVSVEFAKRYPKYVERLVLCSPPFYWARQKHAVGHKEKQLFKLFEYARKNPQNFIKITVMATRLGLTNKWLNVNDQTIDAYMQTLEASILNQTSIEDVTTLHQPVTVIYGSLDPVIVHANLKAALRLMPNAKLVKIVAGHDLDRRYARAIDNELSSVV